MKKKYIVILIIILLIVLGIVGWFVYQQIKENGRQYEIEKLSVDNYQYFILRQNGIKIKNKYMHNIVIYSR